MKKFCHVSTVLLFVSLQFSVSAHEGMWLPTVLKSIEGDMQTAGLQLTAEDIYSLNSGSLKDAIVLFGGGCTAEVISGKGLILTNHHCGFSAISHHSTLENDLLKNGFWAKDIRAELRNPSLTATFVVRMEDVTDQVLPELAGSLSETERQDAVDQLTEEITKKAITGTHYQAVVRPFNYGNSYYLIVTETYRDIRLVGAPPSAIGKFGGDTDNWMWPRHNADFSMFRIYAGANNEPADVSDSNVPFAPRHVLPISMDGVKEGDFAMIFGFPGSTQRYLSSYAVDYVVNISDPMRIEMRTASLEVIDAAMRNDDLTRLRYADKQAGISNAWKKWIGEVRGLKELNTVERKREYEKGYTAKALADGRKDFAMVLPELNVLYSEYMPYAKARDIFVEMAYYGPQALRYADGFRGILEGHERLSAEGKLTEAIAERLSASEGYFADYDVEVDKRIFKALLPIYRKHVPAELAPDFLKEIDTEYVGNSNAWIEALYAKSPFVDHVKLKKAFASPKGKKLQKLASDPFYKVSRELFSNFVEKVRPRHTELSDEIEAAMRKYVEGMMVLYPEKTYWPDANSTLRLSYGKIEGSNPRDGVEFLPHTTLDGVVEKYIPGDAEFDLPERLLDLHKAKDYGAYAVNGTVPVCFTSSLHTTGGNSGSPVLNGRGELVGINFDRSWESTMSDIQFNPDKCRNISVDIRYVLFMVDKYAGASHLVSEMQLVRNNDPKVIDLPIHR
ncbi:MAG: S46 family peptidase [Flavobacteriales bacterium]|nr:S46 family peptidase [Flavobacteriales bacterium]MBK6946017.1 S46 family peptidase [Flavobacteriales bacterium]MBK7239045.1 S46 family peptidase [Flavobacteriales bacterium]MBK9536850.1 S46 family peptidase [Flavobacteriales bacterium]